MGTGNFHNRNASKVYAVLMNYEEPVLDENDNETGETRTVSCEDFEYEDLGYNINEKFKEAEKKGLFQFVEKNEYDTDCLRSFPSRIKGIVYKSKCFGDVEVEVCISLLLTNGYYEGANLDYLEPEVTFNGYDSDFKYSSDMSEGMKVIQSKNADKWTNKQIAFLTEEIEKIYTELSTPLNVVARFSNGETMYAKA